MFDSNFTFSNHVSQVIKSTRAHTRDLYRIRPLLDLKTSVLLANALVSSRLDYCNSLFLSLTDFELRKLQVVQNSLCRVVTRSSKFSHITPQLKKLHWLPVRYRVQFKLVPLSHLSGNTSKPTFSTLASQLSLLPSRSHPQTWYTDLERDSSYKKMILLTSALSSP